MTLGWVGRARTPHPEWFLVASAEYGTVIPILDYGEGPTEYGRDVLYVRCASRQRAKVLALRAWRRQNRRNWRKAGFLEDGCPFTGMIVERCADFPDESVGARPPTETR